jgi:hypothetical protein
MGGMAQTPLTLLQEIEGFLSETGMGETYFGKKSAGNSELVARLRDGRRVWPETEIKIRSFMAVARHDIRKSGHVRQSAAVQGVSN